MPPHPHEEFIRLSALAIAGDLTPEEHTRLDAHLSECEQCRAVHQQYQEIATGVLPILAAEIAPEPDDAPGSADWSLEDAERRLMRTIDERTPAPSRDKRKAFKKNLLLSAAAVAVASAGVLGYYAGDRHAAKSYPANSSVATPPALSPATPSSNNSPALRPAADENASGAGMNRLKEKIVHTETNATGLQLRLNQADQQLKDQKDTLTQVQFERDRLAQQLISEQGSSEALKAKLAELSTVTPSDPKKAQELQDEIARLNHIIDQKDHTIAQDTQLLDHDRDIRNLMGARNLYIAEVYDVAKNGETQKPFGRVFYTRDKSLIFYGFDLDESTRVNDASVFQAWGRRSGPQDVSLGIFYLDDASKNRWVLKVNDAETLARLDAVFVTVEPKGGSTKPSGKPLLFTYLHIAPNHP